MTVRKYTVLVADDDPQILRLVSRNLQMEGFQTVVAANGQEALDMAMAEPPDLAILDVMMPRLDGFTVCQRIRQFSALPIIMLTARGQDLEKVRGLDLGADDYVTKPFNVEELLARVRSVLRRVDLTSQTHAQSEPITIGTLTIDFTQHLVTRQGQEIALTPTEYQLLAYFSHNVGRVLTQNMLLEQVWGSEYSGEHHMLQVNINRLRRKIEPDPAHPTSIITKPGIGYLFAREDDL